jgi:hypothetical protein
VRDICAFDVEDIKPAPRLSLLLLTVVVPVVAAVLTGHCDSRRMPDREGEGAMRASVSVHGRDKLKRERGGAVRGHMPQLLVLRLLAQVLKGIEFALQPLLLPPAIVVLNASYRGKRRMCTCAC